MRSYRREQALVQRCGVLTERATWPPIHGGENTRGHYSEVGVTLPEAEALSTGQRSTRSRSGSWNREEPSGPRSPSSPHRPCPQPVCGLKCFHRGSGDQGSGRHLQSSSLIPGSDSRATDNILFLGLFMGMELKVKVISTAELEACPSGSALQPEGHLRQIPNCLFPFDGTLVSVQLCLWKVRM